MNKIRRGLQNGKLRTLLGAWLPVLMGVLALFFYYFSGHSIFERYPVISNIIIMMAGLTAILSATAYNLRVKAFEYYLKLMSTDLPSKQVAENACKTGYTLTHLILLSLLTTIVLSFSAGNLQHSASRITTCLGIGLLIACLVQYIYVLFAFEKIESLIMEYHLKRRQKDNREKELAHIEKLRQKPDTSIPASWNRSI